MAYTNWSQTRPIGRKMAISLAMGFLAAPLAATLPPAVNPASASSPQSPLIGFFTRNQSGPVRLFSDQKDLGSKEELVYLTEKGETGGIRDIRPFTDADRRREIESESYDSFPGQCFDGHGNASISVYVGSQGKRILEDPLDSQFGFLLKPGSTVRRSREPKSFVVTYGRSDFLLKHYLSSESVHVECRSLPSRKMLAHFSYYLGYEVEPDVTAEEGGKEGVAP